MDNRRLGAESAGMGFEASRREDRFITIGFLDAVMVVLVWTPRADAYRIISMRKANERERALYTTRF